MCIFGGVLSDGILGRFKTICILFIVYCFASTLISISSMPVFMFSPNAALIIGLVLVSIGAGGISPCISAFGADQFKIPEQSEYIATYFSLFYVSINIGAFLSHAIPPILRSDFQCFDQKDCYPLGFGVPAILMFIAIGTIIIRFFRLRKYYKLFIEISFKLYSCVENHHTRELKFHLKIYLVKSRNASR